MTYGLVCGQVAVLGFFEVALIAREGENNVFYRRQTLHLNDMARKGSHAPRWTKRSKSILSKESSKGLCTQWKPGGHAPTCVSAAAAAADGDDDDDDHDDENTASTSVPLYC